MKRIISQNRKKELEYLCLQYQEMKSELAHINLRKGGTEWDDPTYEEVAYRDKLQKRIRIIDEALDESCGGVLRPYMFKCVTKGEKYNKLRAYDDIPCGQRQFYDLKDEFLIILSQKEHTFL